MARTQYNDETRAAVMAALLAGQSLSELARQFSIPKSTLANWSTEARKNGTVPNESRERIGALLLGYVETTLETLQAQQVVFRDDVWIKKQSAAEIAVLHGASVDRVIRLLEGLADEGIPEPPDTS